MSKKSSLKSNRIIGPILLLAGLLLSVTSCSQLGLGQAVDTEPVVLSISEPGPDVIIRDTFVVTGKISDDSNINSSNLILTLKNNRTNIVYQYGTKNAKVKDSKGTINVVHGDNRRNGTWSVEINPEKVNIPDGSYELSVSAIDEGSHETRVSTVFKIDNTPPLVVLTRPSTKIDAFNFDSYGQEFSISGQAADDSNIDLMEIEVYSVDNPDEPVAVVPLKNVPPTIDLTVASAKSDDGYYKKIYGENSEGMKKFYCVVKAYDEARRVPAQEGDKGNVAEYFYFYNDIYSDLLTQYKITDLYHMLNGTYTESDTGSAFEGPLGLLTGKKSGKAAFSLNPTNNPTYEIAGMETIDAILHFPAKWDTESSKALNGLQPTINIKPGLDNAPLLKETIGVYLKQVKDDGTPIDEKSIELVAPGSGDFTTVGSGYSIVLNLSIKKYPELNLGKNYRFYVVGKDANGKEILSGSDFYDYGFKLYSNGTVPNLEAKAYSVTGDGTEKEIGTVSFDISNDESVVIKGSLKVDTGGVELSAEMSVPGRAEDKKYTVQNRSIVLGSGVEIANGLKYDFVLTIPKDDFESGTNTLQLIANREGEDLTTGKTFTINLDKDAPSVKDVSVDGLEFDAKKIYNGIVTVKAYAEDNEMVTSARYEIVCGDKKFGGPDVEESYIKPADLRTQGFKIDTRIYDDEAGTGDVKVTIYAKDKAGNESEPVSVTLKVDQETDRPVFAATAPLDLENKASADIGVNGTNLFDKSQNLEFVVSDDDGLTEIKIYEGKKTSARLVYEKTALAGVKSFTVNAPVFGSAEGHLNLGSGEKILCVYAKDSALGVEKEIGDIHIFIDDNPLSISLVTENDENITDGTRFDSNGTFQFKLKVQEKDGNLVSLEYRDDEGEPVSLLEKIDTENRNVQTVGIIAESKDENGNTISKKITRVFTATNKYKRVKTVSLTVNFDGDKPVVETAVLAYDTDNGKIINEYFDGTQYLKLSVVAKEDDTEAKKEFQTGLSKVQYAVFSGEDVKVDWTNMIKETAAWQATVSNNVLPEGEYTFRFRALDAVGNESINKAITAICDKNKPVFTGPSAIKENNNTVVEISGTLTEKYLNSYTVNLQKRGDYDSENGVWKWNNSGNRILTEEKKPDGNSDKAWKVSVAAKTNGVSNDGVYRLVLNAEDKVGNEGSWTSPEFRIDTTAPVIDSSEGKFSLGGKGFGEVNTNWYKKDSLKLEARYEESGSGVNKVTVRVKKSDNTEVSIEPSVKRVEEAGKVYFSFSEQLDLLESVSDSHNVITINSIDEAGNLSGVSIFTVKVDTHAPVVDVEKLSAGGISLAEGANKPVNGKSNVEIAVPVKDVLSGVKSVKYKFAGKVKTETVDAVTSDDEDDGMYKFKIDCMKKKDLLKDTSVYIVVEDNADNKSETKLFTFDFDDKDPAVKFESHKNNDVVNRKITLKGTITDNRNLASATISCGNKDAEDLKLSGSVWEHEINTEDFEDGNVSFKISATDEAGNGTDEMLTLVVNQDSDRPVIRLVNISEPKDVVLNTKTIDLFVTDDDGTADLTLKIATDISEGKENWETVTLSNGSGSFTPDIQKGRENEPINLYFWVKDAEGKDFQTKVGAEGKDLLDVPYICYVKDDNKKDNNEEISYTFDADNPEITEVEIGFGDSETDITYQAAGKKAILAGGTTRAYVKFAVTARDDIGVESVTVTGIDSVTMTKAEDGKWYSEAIRVSELTEGNVTVSFAATDKCGKTDRDSKTASLNVDKTGPSVTLQASATRYTGNPRLKGDYADEGGSTVKAETFRYVVLDDTYYTATGVNEELVKSVFADKENIPAGGNPVVIPGKDDIEHSVAGWTLKEMQNVPVSSAMFEKFAGSLENPSADPQTYDYALKIAVYLEDALGNGKVTVLDVPYNPYGNRPTAEISDPVETTSNVPAQKNGSIRISGSSEKGPADNAADVYAVFLQFDVNGDGRFDVNDKNIINGTAKDDDSNEYNVAAIWKDRYYDAEKVPDGLTLNTESLGNDSFWGIMANGNPLNWYLSINSRMEFQIDRFSLKESDGTEFKIAVRAIAMTSDGVLGSWTSPEYIKIDTNVPVVGEEETVLEYKANGTEVNETRTYSQDMFVKGKSELVVTVEDRQEPGKGGLSKVLYYTSLTKAGLNTSSAGKGECNLPSSFKTFSRNVGTADKPEIINTYGYQVTIPLSRDNKTSGTLWVKVVAFKENEQSSYAVYNVNFDNTAPEIENFKLNSVLYEDSDKKIVNSNGVFTLSGKMTDAGAGFERAAFYYKRGKGETERIYDVMQDEDNKILISTLKSETVGGKKLYGTEQSVKIETENGVSILTLERDVDHIRAGGLVVIGGSYLVIQAKDSNSKTVTLRSESPVKNSESEKVFFPYVQVVDNTGSEKPDANGLTFIKNKESDDGDGMPESIVKSQTSWTWDASIQSKRIPDGPGTMVIFVWDKAGNVSSKEYDCSVQNNAPRLVKLHLGTDLNNNDEYEDDETVTYDVLTQDGKQSSYIMSTSAYRGKSFKVKNGFAVVPEFVGGNLYSGDKDIKMILNNAADDETLGSFNSMTDDAVLYRDMKSTVLNADGKLMKNIGKTDVDGTQRENNMYAFVIANDDLGEESPSADLESGRGNRKMSFTFWDSTEETIQGVDSCYMYLQINDLIIDVEDKDAPKIWIKPFKWNSNSDCSAVIDREGIKGHIDLGAIPKVSGQVKICGTAYDNTKLGSIYFSDPSGSKKFKVGEYSNGRWVEVKTGWPESWKKFEIIKDYGITQDGHTVEWQMTLDTTPFGVGNKKVITVKANDAQGNELSYPGNAVSSTTEAVPTAKYVMDFVPYIQKLSIVDNMTETKLNRSRLGQYVAAIKEDRKLRIYGMNFTSNANYEVHFYRSGADGKQDSSKDVTVNAITNQYYIEKNTGYIEVAMPDYSCWVEVSVAGIRTSNNTNSNEVDYNIEEGNDSTRENGKNFWTDDKYLSVWNVETSLPGSINPHSGLVKKVTQKNSGSKKTSKDSAGGGYLYKQKGYSAAVESYGNQHDRYYAALSSDDLKVYGYMGSRETDYTNPGFQNYMHGDNVIFKDSEACFKVPVDTLDYTIVNGLPYYVMQDNFITGDSANIWGPGLFISREGMWWDRPYLSKDGNDIEESKNYFIIERQGASGSKAASRDSSTGYDAVLQQFKNPRIAGYYNADDTLKYTTADGGKNVKGVDYVYVSYYDSYAKCLKYAGYKIGHRLSNDDKIDGVDSKQWGYHNERSDIVPLMHNAVHEANRNNNNNGITDSNNMTNGYSVVAGWDTLVSNPSVFEERAGEWSDIMIDPKTHVPVIIYYNETRRSLEVAYANNIAPATGNICDDEGNFSEDYTEDSVYGWTKTKNITPDAGIDFGRYVSAEMDVNGNIHATAMDESNGRLYYIFLEKSGKLYTPSYQLIDATDSVGLWTDIQLNNDSSENSNWYDYQPVISYLSKTRLKSVNAVKVAFVNAAHEWDCMTDPAKYAGDDQRTSVMASVYEGATDIKSKIGVGFNSDVYAIDFLRGEE